jgi:hypothetical protein
VPAIVVEGLERAFGEVLAVQAVHRHREAPLGGAAPPAPADGVQLRQRGLRQLAHRPDLDRVARAHHAVDRLADLLDSPAVQ